MDKEIKEAERKMDENLESTGFSHISYINTLMIHEMQKQETRWHVILAALLAGNFVVDILQVWGG